MLAEVEVMLTGYSIFNLFIYVLERGQGREKERERNIDAPEKCLLIASYAHSNRGPNLQPGHVP